MCGILFAVVVLAAIVASVLHVSAGWALVLVVGGVVVAAVIQARNPNAAIRTGKTGLVFTNVCPACKRHNKSGATVCAHCSTALVVAKQPAEDATKVCPDCAERVRAEARKCRYCGHEFPTAAAPTT